MARLESAYARSDPSAACLSPLFFLLSPVQSSLYGRLFFTPRLVNVSTGLLMFSSLISRPASRSPDHSLINAPLVIETKIHRTIFTTCSWTNGQTPLPTSLFERVQSKSHFLFSTLVSCLLNHEVFSSHRISALCVLETRSDRLYWPFQPNWCDFSISKPMSLLSGR